MNGATGGREPAFGVLDVVEVAAPLAGLGLAGQRGAVLEVRRYPDGSYCYVVGPVLGDSHEGGSHDGDDCSVIYGQAQLIATGRRVDAGCYGPPAPFRSRDVVKISEDCAMEEARGREGYIVSGLRQEPVGVWVHGLEEVCVIETRYLTRTGKRMPLSPREVQRSSARVTVDGEVAGWAGYAVVDNVEHYL